MIPVATLGLVEAAEHSWDVVVVGAGPAGALAAREAARRGLTVLLVDKASFPRWKVCGSCLNLWSLSTLESVGLGELVGRCGALSLEGVRLAAWGRQAFLPLPGGAALSRLALDSALVAAAVQEGANFLPRTLARLGPCGTETRSVILSHDDAETVAAARVVLAADGLGGRLPRDEPALHPVVDSTSRIGAGVIAETVPGSYEPGTIFMACGRGGYVGLVRVEDGRLDIAAALEPELVKCTGGPGKAAEAILAEAGLPAVPRMASLRWHGTPMLTRRVAPPAAERLFLLGDAATYVEPFTGEGIAWALASGAAVASLVCRACRRWDPVLVMHWSVWYRRMIGRRQWACRGVAQLLRRPVLTRAVLGLLARAPGLASPLIRYLNAPVNHTHPDAGQPGWGSGVPCRSTARRSPAPP